MASIWKGSIAFGLVNIPVDLRSAVREENISFRQLHEADMAPIRYERVCSVDGETVPYNEIVKGYEYAKGKYVVMDDEDFKAAAIESSRTIDILDFVQLEEIDPRHFDTPYFLLPGKGGEKGYALLREAIRSTGAVGVGKVTMRQKQHLCALRVLDDAIILEMMRFGTELVDTSEFTFPSAEGLREQEIKMAQQLVQSLTDAFDPSKYKDDYRENVMEIIKAKMKGKKVSYEEPAAREPTEVLDLMSRLQASLDQVKPKKGGGDAAAGTAKKKADKKAESGEKKTEKKRRKTA